MVDCRMTLEIKKSKGVKVKAKVEEGRMLHRVQE